MKELKKILNSNDFYGASENIEIAKGKYKIPETFKESFEQTKRKIKWQKR